MRVTLVQTRLLEHVEVVKIEVDIFELWLINDVKEIVIIVRSMGGDANIDENKIGNACDAYMSNATYNLQPSHAYKAY